MPDEVSTIARKLEVFIRKVFPDAVKVEDKTEVGFGFGRGYKGLVFVISPQKTHVNLGITNGAALQDSFPLLQGSGKVHRHVKITGLSDLATRELKRLMKTALKAARERHEEGA